MLAQHQCNPALAGNSVQIFDHFLSKFSIQTEINPIIKTQGFTCIANFPACFAHLPFKYQIQGIPFETEDAAREHLQMKLVLPLSAMSAWTSDQQTSYKSTGKHLDGKFQLTLGCDALATLYLKEIKTEHKKRLRPHGTGVHALHDDAQECNGWLRTLATSWEYTGLSVLWLNQGGTAPACLSLDTHLAQHVQVNGAR